METQVYASTGLSTLTTANSNLDGTGTVVTLFTAGSTNGSIIRSISIKAGGNTSQGMIRLFIDNGSGSKSLIMEVNVPAVTQSSQDRTFERHIPIELRLVANCVLYGSTENSETFYVIVEAVNWAYISSGVRSDRTQYTANSGMVAIATANSNLDGTGTVATVLTAGSLISGWKGCRIKNLTIKAGGNTTRGMVRIFVKVSSTINLLTEIPIPAVTASSTSGSFSQILHFNGSFYIVPGGQIIASTQNAETFYITADAEDYTYPS